MEENYIKSPYVVNQAIRVSYNSHCLVSEENYIFSKCVNLRLYMLTAIFRLFFWYIVSFTLYMQIVKDMQCLHIAVLNEYYEY